MAIQVAWFSAKQNPNMSRVKTNKQKYTLIPSQDKMAEYK